MVTIDPVRILDTRDPVNIGLPGPFVSAVSQKLQVTGPAVPAGATGVLLNVTVVSPTANGFLAIRPGDATGAPSTSSLNFNAGDLIPNSMQVGLPTAGSNAGKIDITYDAYGVPGPTADVLIDVVGYMVAGAAGPAGPTGATGAAGAKGDPGPGYDLARVVWVATSGGDFTSLSDALASITNASASTPYVIKIAPGVYTEAATAWLPSYVDIEGSGEGVTTLTCACVAVAQGGISGATLLSNGTRAEVRNITVANTGGGNYSAALATANGQPGDLRLTHVTAITTGSDYSYGVYNTFSSSPTMTDVTATATGVTSSFGVYNEAGAFPKIRNSSLTGGDFSIGNFSGATAYVADSTLVGPTTGGGFKCVGVYDAAFAALNTTCT